MISTIAKLDEKIEELIEQQRLSGIANYWEPQEYTAKDHWRGIPRHSKVLDMIPFTVEPEIPMWAAILNFSVKEFYSIPRVYLENTLKMMIYRAEKFQDFTCIEKTIPIWLGAPFEESLFGSKQVLVEGASPWLDREPLIKKQEDLDRLEFPDFYKSGLMPTAHYFYEVIGELTEGKYTVVFPEWGRGPFGVAFHLRGFDNLLIDMLVNPDFVHRLMRFVTDARKHWVSERAKFLGRKIDKGNLYNDEVNCPTLSPEQYKEFVLPYEIELCNFHGGIVYWHSCGDIANLAEGISRIPYLEMLHIGPWTDMKEVRRVFGERVAYEKCLMPTEDVQMATEEEMEKKLEEIRGVLDGTAYTVRADGLQIVSSVDRDIEKVIKWVTIARKKLKIEKGERG